MSDAVLQKEIEEARGRLEALLKKADEPEKLEKTLDKKVQFDDDHQTSGAGAVLDGAETKTSEGNNSKPWRPRKSHKGSFTFVHRGERNNESLTIRKLHANQFTECL